MPTKVAFKKFKAEQDSYSQDEIDSLAKAIEYSADSKPSYRLLNSWRSSFGSADFVPTQYKKDTLMVDYLVSKRAMEFERAIELFDDFDSIRFKP